jgi:hypothetical protein
MNRIEIEMKLNENRNWLLATFGGMSEEQRRAPLTQSQHDQQTYWSTLDHFAHLALIERDFAQMIRRQLQGRANPVGLRTDENGRERTRAEIMAIVNRHTETFKEEHHLDSFEAIVALTGAARGETLVLLAELTDEQLTQPLVGAPWADGTIGGVIANNADHALRHWHWLNEAGLAESVERQAG